MIARQIRWTILCCYNSSIESLALFLGNMLRARRYRFALCFRVLSNQYVERSAYANVFKFNREDKRCERAKVIPDVSTGFWSPCWSPQHGVSILKTIIFSDTLCRITRVRNIAHPRNFSALFIRYSSKIHYSVRRPSVLAWKNPTRFTLLIILRQTFTCFQFN